MAKLVCVYGMNKGDEFPLREGTNVVGRAQDANVILFDKKCSRSHCMILKKGSYFTIEDTGSRHGTFVNGKLVTKRRSVSYGDKVKLGRTLLLLSDKPLGTLMDQTVVDAAADLQTKEFDHLIDSAAADVYKTRVASHAADKPKLLTRVWRFLNRPIG